jgi:hypothetical protein
MKPQLNLLLILQLSAIISTGVAFAPVVLLQWKAPANNQHLHSLQKNHHPSRRAPGMTTTTTPTSLNALLEVPEGFFTITLFTSGILLQISKNFARLRMEERAWEQRLEEGRIQRLREDPTLTELDLRRKEAAMEWSAYGKPRMEEERLQRERKEREQKRVKVMDRDDDDDDEATYREHHMSDDDITLFEAEYGIDFDPYYDDPYTEDELPEDINFKVDKRYGDRIYENGEIFYKDKQSGLYYRQGAKPRNLSFWK